MPAIEWPTKYHPVNNPLHCANRFQINATPERVWAWLIRADRWPSYYDRCRWVRFKNGTGLNLSLGRQFQWKTSDSGFVSTVLEFQAPHRIAWEVKGLGVDGYQAWLLEANPQGCLVTLESTRRGWADRLLQFAIKPIVDSSQQQWLEGLARICPAGTPEKLGARAS